MVWWLVPVFAFLIDSPFSFLVRPWFDPRSFMAKFHRRANRLRQPTPTSTMNWQQTVVGSILSHSCKVVVVVLVTRTNQLEQLLHLTHPVVPVQVHCTGASERHLHDIARNLLTGTTLGSLQPSPHLQEFQWTPEIFCRATAATNGSSPRP